MWSSQDAEMALNRPKIFAYGAERRVSRTSLDRDIEDRGGHANLFGATDLVSPCEWLLRWDYLSKSDPTQKSRYRMLCDVIIGLLPEVKEVNVHIDEHSRTSVLYLTSNGWMPMRQLSVGYQTMGAWIIDFAARLFAANPDSEEPLTEDAVLIIDEFDLHLHPKWQRESVDFLTKTFPRTQFIISAHSPLIVQNAPNANIVLLRRDGESVQVVSGMEEIHGWTIDQILTSNLYGLETARSSHFESLMRERREILEQKELSKANEDRLDEIREQLVALPTGDTAWELKAMELISHYASKLREGE
jgi:hypothetical protein